jgi:uncharacterized protein (DUF934 family)
VLPERVIRGDPPRVEPESWRLLETLNEEALRGKIVLPLAAWLSRRTELAARVEPTGVWLRSDDDPQALGHDIFELPLIALQFPAYGDGRGYSSAVILRRRGFRGELRAFGDIGRDHLFHLRRCGFDAFSLSAQRDPHDALAAFDEYSERYQGSVDESAPLFRRRSVHG